MLTWPAYFYFVQFLVSKGQTPLVPGIVDVCEGVLHLPSPFIWWQSLLVGLWTTPCCYATYFYYNNNFLINNLTWMHPVSDAFCSLLLSQLGNFMLLYYCGRAMTPSPIKCTSFLILLWQTDFSLFGLLFTAKCIVLVLKFVLLQCFKYNSQIKDLTWTSFTMIRPVSTSME